MSAFGFPRGPMLERIKHPITLEAYFPGENDDVKTIVFKPPTGGSVWPVLRETDKTIETTVRDAKGERVEVMLPGVHLPTPMNYNLRRFMLTADPGHYLHSSDKQTFDESVDVLASAGMFDMRLGPKGYYNAPLLSICGRGYPASWTELEIPEELFDPKKGISELTGRGLPLHLPSEQNVRFAIEFTRPVSVPDTVRFVLVLDGDIGREVQ